MGEQDNVSLSVDEFVEFGNEFSNCDMLTMAEEKVVVSVSPGSSCEVVCLENFVNWCCADGFGVEDTDSHLCFEVWLIGIIHEPLNIFEVD